jgi:DNA-binding transcriptional LysR family regulator
MKFSLKQIEVFLATANYQNITQAAEQLSMSQSAASESLKTLENQFGIQLFDRIGKRLQLNDLGENVKKQAKPFMERARTLEDSLQQNTKLSSLKVGATLSIGNYLAINILSAFRDLYDGANATLEVENTTAIAHKVANFELDIGLIEGEVSHEDLDVIPWREDELVVFCSPNHPYATKRTLNDQELIDAQWILRETGSGTRQAFDYAMHGLLPNLKVTLELQHTEAIKRAVEAGMGLGCLSKITLNDAFSRGNLVPIHIPHRNFHRQFYFIIHKDKYRSHSINSWLELCQKQFLS